MDTNVNDSNKNLKQTVAEKIIDQLINGSAVLFHDQHGEAYIAEFGNGSKVYKLASRDFKSWIAHYYWNTERKAIPRDADMQVIQTLTAYAKFEGQKYDLSIRLSRKSDVLWYDLADGKAVKVDRTGWTIHSNPPILFRRGQQLPQVTPENSGDIRLLRSYVNVASEDDWLLFIVYLVSAFIPDFPHPLLILHGPQGAGKTTPMRIIKELVDPSIIQGVPLPEKVVEFVQLADHHAFLFFDNLSKMPTSMSDALARAATGDSFSKRQLYTDNDNIVYRIQKTIALNGINQVITKPDLLDRAILIKLKRISPVDRIAEEDFWPSFHDNKAHILGAIFDVLAKSIELYPSIKLENSPRMADFARWGCAISESLGYKHSQFLDAYQNNIDRQNEEAIEASPVARAVITLMSNSDKWQGSAEQLLRELNIKFGATSLSSSPLWPKAPEWMTRRLNDVETNLNALGIRIDTERTKEGRLLIISRDQHQSDMQFTDDSMSV